MLLTRLPGCVYSRGMEQKSITVTLTGLTQPATVDALRRVGIALDRNEYLLVLAKTMVIGELTDTTVTAVFDILAPSVVDLANVLRAFFASALPQFIAEIHVN